uniref:Uncharacterized protein n=1 Tax=Homalodisca liturata TaxID=320908 RepID=A0A1B6JPY2_9HEMI
MIQKWLRGLLLIVVLKTTDTTINFENMTLQELDTKLVEMLTSPKKGEGSNLMNGSLFYFNQLENISAQCVQNCSTEHKSDFNCSKISLIRSIVKSGLPKFTSVKLKKRYLRDKYNWRDAQFIEFETYTLGIKIILRRCKEYLEVFKNK